MSVFCCCCYYFFVFKQKTAYEMRISDWSSDVCSSDLKTGRVSGITLPDGLLQAQQLPQPVFTPSTKAAVGDHDENIDFDTMVRGIGAELRSEERRVGKECVVRVDLGGRRLIKKQKQINIFTHKQLAIINHNTYL